MKVYRIAQLILGAADTNCWIVVYDDGPAGDASTAPSMEATQPCALIDPGAEPEKIIAQLTAMALRPRHILLTHGHFDHTFALPDIHAAYPQASIGIHRRDVPYLGPESLDLHRRSFSAAVGTATDAGGGGGTYGGASGGGDLSYIDALWKPLPGADREFEDGDRIGPFKVLSSPGHTPGSAAFLLEEQKILFSGDTLFKGGCGRVDLPGGDRREIEKSLKRLLALDGDITVLPGHGEATTIAAERGTGST
ncbi:MAG: MBL fold metallo-hydrolase [Treponema sp.]|jgi:glyoxylase-like metal-dependent hydrolase (beta-lactamase superfamily II)|nr:MBL fold metallo-hydrolase [Treponema sp.]